MQEEPDESNTEWWSCSTRMWLRVGLCLLVANGATPRSSAVTQILSWTNEDLVPWRRRSPALALYIRGTDRPNHAERSSPVSCKCQLAVVAAAAAAGGTIAHSVAPARRLIYVCLPPMYPPLQPGSVGPHVLVLPTYSSPHLTSPPADSQPDSTRMSVRRSVVRPCVSLV